MTKTGTQIIIDTVARRTVKRPCPPDLSADELACLAADLRSGKPVDGEVPYRPLVAVK